MQTSFLKKGFELCTLHLSMFIKLVGVDLCMMVGDREETKLASKVGMVQSPL